MQLAGRAVNLRPVLPEDAPRLLEIVTHPEVARWWPAWDADRVDRDLIAADPHSVHLAIEHDGRVIGALQAWEEPDAEYRHAGIDLFLDPAVRGRDLGPDAIRAVAAWLLDDRGHHRLTIDPAADNAAAIRAYEKVGFRPVGRLRRYQRMADGSWADGLLMEMLADELVRDG